jgi:chemotaxis protein CheD
MRAYTLNIGDVITSTRPAHYTCYGLGSCIGLFIQDRATGMTAGAHIFLPENESAPGDRTKFYGAGSAITEILSRFKSMGSNLHMLRAKIAGGANVVGVNVSVGQRNAESVMRHLMMNRIFVAGSDVGGTQSRTTVFETETGALKVHLPGQKEYRI